MSGKNRATQAEIKERRQRCADYIIEYAPNYSQFILWHKDAFTKGKNTATTDWQNAWSIVAKEGNISTDAKRWRRISQLEKQYEDADTAKDKATIVMMASKLEGIDVNKHEIEAHVKADKPIFNIKLDDGVDTDSDV